MKSKSIKKILAFMTSIVMLSSYTTPVLAINNGDSVFTSDESIMCGYDRIYRDVEGSSWIMAKPATPDNEVININFDAIQGEAYTFSLMNMLMEKEILKVTGSADQTGSNNIELNIPGETENGIYKLVGKIGEKNETVKEVTIDGNLALTSNITSNYAGTIDNVKDLTINNLEAVGNPSNKPIEITFNFEKNSSISSIDIFSSHIDGQGPTEVELYYKDGEEYKKIDKIYNQLTWTQYVNQDGENINSGAPRKKTTLELPESVTTDSIKVKVTKGNTSWGKVVFDEIMVWGHKITDNYEIYMGQSIGTENKENIITVTGKSVGQYSDSQVKIQLFKEDELIAEENSQFENGNLSAILKTPANIQTGAYTVKVTSDDGINKIFNYNVKGELTYETNIDENLSPFTSRYTDYKSIDEVMDDNYETFYTTDSIKLWNKNVETEEQFVARNIKIYADKDSFDSVEVLVGTEKNTNSQFTKALDFNNLTWQEDENGNYVELYTAFNFLSFGYELKFNKIANIKEINVDGIYFKENLLKDAIVKYNDEVIDGSDMFDNSNLTRVEFGDNNGSGNQIIELDFENGKIYSIDKLFVSSNYVLKQGMKNAKVSYWQDGNWIEVESKISSTYKGDDDNKKEMMVIDLPHIQTTKIKIEAQFNTFWSHGVIFELNALGTSEYDESSFAALIDKVDTMNSGNVRVTFNYLDKIVKNWDDNFEIRIASSSDVNVIGLDGIVNHATEDKISNIKVEVTDRKTGEKSLSNDIEVAVPRKLTGNIAQADIQIDETTAYQNPAMGWVAYVEGFECAVHDRFEYANQTKSINDFSINNWNARNKGLCVEIGTDAASAREYTKQMDELIEEGMPVNILYIREPWSWFEPVKGQYAWEDENSACYELINWAKDNNIQLAFRIITCSSATAQQATPEWVFDDGATYVTRNHDYVRNAKDPYLNDEIFQRHFKEFVNALGEEFNNEDTAFVDAHGHGQWGEMNSMVDVSAGGNRKATIQYLENCFIEAFPDVLLGGQQGSSGGGGAIEESFNTEGNNFVVRRDAFGSDIYLRNTGNAAKIKEYRAQGIPVFAENCYHHFDSRNFRWSNNIAYSSGSVGEYGGDNPFDTMNDMMNKVIYDAIDLGANTIDLRTLEDAKLWMENGQEYLDKFTQEGGYRISVTDATYTNLVKAGEYINIDSTWQNNGVGILPNKNKRWNNKMKVAYALIDNDGNIVQQQIISTDEINAGDFEKGNDYSYESQFKVDENLKSGTYRLAVSILNEKDDYQPGVQLANKGEVTNGGWLTLGNVNVNGKDTVVEQTIEGEGTISFDRKELLVGESATMTVTAEEGYEISYVEVNGERIELANNSYTFEELPNTLNIKVVFNVLLEVDKSELEALVADIEDIDISKYTTESVNKFNLELSNAKSILADNEATQEEVDSAYNTLIKAYLDLRLIPDKSKLEDLINKAKALDLSVYTEESANELKIQLERSDEVFLNEDATHEEINEAVTLLGTALDNLIAKGDSNGGAGNNGNDGSANGNNTDGNNSNETEKPGDSNKTENQGTSNGGKLPSTGVETGAFGVVAVASIILGLGLMYRKRHKKIS